MIKIALCASALLALTTTASFALERSDSVDVAASPAKVWATIGDFCGIGTWHPAIERCAPSMQGAKIIRTLYLKGGGSIVEEQLSRDDGAMKYSYTILESPLPVADYTSTIAVMPSGSGSKVTWSGSFQAKGADDEKAMAAIGGIYTSGLAAIAEKSK